MWQNWTLNTEHKTEQMWQNWTQCLGVKKLSQTHFYTAGHLHIMFIVFCLSKYDRDCDQGNPNMSLYLIKKKLFQFSSQVPYNPVYVYLDYRDIKVEIFIIILKSKSSNF